MKPLTRPICWSGALLLAAVAGTGFYWQRVSSLSRQNQTLELQLQAANPVSANGRSIEQLRSESAEVRQLKTETRDLHKLRNEVRQLREQTKYFDKLRAENERLRAAVAKMGKSSASATAPAAPRPTFTFEQLRNAGYASPEDTLVTMFWAMKAGDLDAANRCWTPESANNRFGGATPEDIRREGESMARTFGELRIAAKRMVSADEALLGVQMLSKQSEAPQEIAMPFKLIDGEWKLNFPAP